jgi:hypothetical protein
MAKVKQTTVYKSFDSNTQDGLGLNVFNVHQHYIRRLPQFDVRIVERIHSAQSS